VARQAVAVPALRAQGVRWHRWWWPSRALVALGDDIGEALGAVAVAVLIGERPGLSAADSLGIYLTWQPRRGRTDAERNCISTVCLEGFAPAVAAEKLLWLIGAMRRLRLTGLGLKDGQIVMLEDAGRQGGGSKMRAY
jgi:ethanolamine ammonia-lyase small subunit